MSSEFRQSIYSGEIQMSIDSMRINEKFQGRNKCILVPDEPGCENFFSEENSWGFWTAGKERLGKFWFIFWLLSRDKARI